MSTNSVFDWSDVAGSNIDVAGNGIAGSSNISLGNDVFQNIMAQIAAGLIERGSDIATASTISFSGATTRALTHDLTGTTTVTAVTLTAGHWRICRAQGAFQLTASSTLVVNGSTSTNYTTTAGDLLIFFGYSASTVRVWTFTGGATGAATTSTAGTVKLATNAQAEVGTDTAAALTSSNLAAVLNAGTDNSGGATITMGDGGYFNLITSTTAITAFAFTNDAVGRTARIRFNTVRTLTYNATSLILPGAANITTAVGDIMQIRSLGSGNFVVEWYSRASAPAAITLGTAVAAASQTSIDFTGIPAGVRRINFSFSSLGTSGTANLLVQIGSGSVTTTGYLSTSNFVNGNLANVGGGTSTSGYYIIKNSSSAVVQGGGTISLENSASSRYSFQANTGWSNTAFAPYSAGTVALSGALDRVRFTTSNGTDTFNAGEINISYEY